MVEEFERDIKRGKLKDEDDLTVAARNTHRWVEEQVYYDF